MSLFLNRKGTKLSLPSVLFAQSHCQALPASTSASHMIYKQEVPGSLALGTGSPPRTEEHTTSSLQSLNPTFFLTSPHYLLPSTPSSSMASFFLLFIPRPPSILLLLHPSSFSILPTLHSQILWVGSTRRGYVYLCIHTGTKWFHAQVTHCNHIPACPCHSTWGAQRPPISSLSTPPLRPH